MDVYRSPHTDPTLTQAWPDWSKSIRKIGMAYEVIVFPILEIAARRFNETNPLDPYALGPDAYANSIREGIRDAQRNPGQNLEEYPHRGPIELNNEELTILGKITKSRGLPFNPQKRVYRYTDHVALLDARMQESQRSVMHFSPDEVGGAINEDMLKTSMQIGEQIRHKKGALAVKLS